MAPNQITPILTLEHSGCRSHNQEVMEQTSTLMPTSRVARRLNVSAERVRQLAREGRLKPVAETELGRLWDPADVEKFSRSRDQWGRYSRPATSERSVPETGDASE
jgi:hypothetical protein